MNTRKGNTDGVGIFTMHVELGLRSWVVQKGRANLTILFVEASQQNGLARQFQIRVLSLLTFLTLCTTLILFRTSSALDTQSISFIRSSDPRTLAQNICSGA